VVFCFLVDSASAVNMAITALRQMVWILQNEISSGMDGFACGAIGPSVSL